MLGGKRMFARLRLAPSVRIGLDRRCEGRCESCGLDWRWALYVFKLVEGERCTRSNLIVLCGSCSSNRDGDFAPLVGSRGTRERMLFANNTRGGATPLTDGRRKALIARRGGTCELCGISATERVLEIHHKQPVLHGGDDREENLQVLCFACHHRLQPCATGCGAWASKRFGICRHCQAQHALEALMPDATWDEIKARFPSFVEQWKPGYEPRAIPSGPAR